MEKLVVKFNSLEEVRIVFDYIFVGIESAKDSLDLDDTFETRNNICTMYRILNQVMCTGNIDCDDLTIPILFAEDFTIDTSFVDDDRLIFDGSDIDGFKIAVEDISKYQVVDDDVIVFGLNQLDNDIPCIIIIGENDWKEILETIEKNKCGNKKIEPIIENYEGGCVAFYKTEANSMGWMEVYEKYDETAFADRSVELNANISVYAANGGKHVMTFGGML